MAGEETERTGSDGKPVPARDVDNNEAELATRLQRLSAGLERHRVAATSNRPARRDDTGYARAVKIGSEFIAGIVVGTGLGWVIDQGLGTRPWGMIIFLLIGFAAGVLNVMRAEGMVGPAVRRPDASEDDDGRRD